MCLVVFALQQRPDSPLVLAANRDEFHGRPTAPAELWPEARQVLAGRDLEGGGTWLGVTATGRVAAVTNYREPARHDPRAASRGALVADFLTGDEAPPTYLDRIARRAGDFNGFSLIVGEGGEVWVFSNREGEPRRLSPGFHGLSNHLLGTPWPKVRRTTDRLEEVLAEGGGIEPEALLTVLADRTPAAEEELPDTGIPRQWERALSAPCIVTPDYGTRSSTALTIGADGLITFAERSLAADGSAVETREFWLQLDGKPWTL